MEPVALLPAVQPGVPLVHGDIGARPAQPLRQAEPAKAATGHGDPQPLHHTSTTRILFFSKSIISGEKSYGPVGVVMIVLSYMVAFGVVVHFGAVVGRHWNERHTAAGEPAGED